MDITIAADRMVRIEGGGVECPLDTHLVRLRLTPRKKGQAPASRQVAGKAAAFPRLRRWRFLPQDARKPRIFWPRVNIRGRTFHRHQYTLGAVKLPPGCPLALAQTATHFKNIVSSLGGDFAADGAQPFQAVIILIGN